MSRRTYPTELYLCTVIERTTADGDTVECDAIVYFDATMTSPGYRATWMEPGEGPEYDCTFSSAALDGDAPDAQGPLTSIEVATLRAWFDKHEAAATECANDNLFCEPSA